MFLAKNIDLQEERKEQEIVENTNTKVTAKAMLPIRFRLLPGDMLSNREFKFYIYIIYTILNRFYTLVFYFYTIYTKFIACFLNLNI